MAIKAFGYLLGGDARLRMTFPDALRFVVMTAVAGKFRVCLSVADLAILFTLLAMVKGEGMNSQIGRCPGLSRVAIFTF